MMGGASSLGGGCQLFVLPVMWGGVVALHLIINEFGASFFTSVQSG